jgi:hypothetical protein
LLAVVDLCILALERIDSQYFQTGDAVLFEHGLAYTFLETGLGKAYCMAHLLAVD